MHQVLPGEDLEPVTLGDKAASGSGPANGTGENAGAPALTYTKTRWGTVNMLLDLVDRITRGKAGWFQRLFSYLLVGGFAAVVNLIVFGMLFYHVFALSLTNYSVRYVVSYAIATEISILANFIPNDRITFSHLPGHSRSWWTRCGRFHITCSVGTALTLIIGYSLTLFGVPALASQAVAIVIVTAFNFMAHHLFTYRHVSKPAA